MNKKDILNAANLYIKHGTLKAASDASGIPASTLNDRIKIGENKGYFTEKTMVKLNDLRTRTSSNDISELKITVNTFNECGTKTEAAATLGISTETLNRRLQKAQQLGIYNPSNSKITKLELEKEELAEEIADLKSKLDQAETNPKFLLDRDREIVKLRDEVKTAASKLKASEKEVVRLENHNEVLTKLSTRKRRKTKITSKSGKAEAVACMIASDWHIEEPVDPEGLNGYNEYNLDIARNRSQNFFKNGLFLAKKEMMSAKIDTLLLGLLGDFISNYIHEELEEEAQLSPTMAIEMAEDLICDGIDFLLKDGSFEKLVIPCTIGNHGRTTKKKRISTGWQNSYEMLMYRHIQKLYESNPRVDVRISKGYHNIVDIYGYIIRFHHGDGITGGQGIGGITIPVNRAIGRWNDKEHAALDVFGHFHQLHFQSKFVSNGSLIGYNQFAQMFGCTPEPPRQSFFLIDKDHGRTVCAPIFVE